MPVPESVELAAEVVAAYISNNALPRADLTSPVQAVHSAFERLGKGTERTPSQAAAKAPSVPVSKSVTPEYLIEVTARSFEAAGPDSGTVSPTVFRTEDRSKPRGRLPLPPISGRFMTNRLRMLADRRAWLCLSRLLPAFGFEFGCEPEFVASTVRPARLLPRLVGEFAGHLFHVAHALFPPRLSLGAGPTPIVAIIWLDACQFSGAHLELLTP